MRFAIANLQFAICIAAGLALSCDRKIQTPSLPARVVPKGNGVVRGVVRFIGTPPLMKEIDNGTCGPDAKKLMQETVLVGPAGGLKNVLVSIEGIGRSDGSNLPPAVLDQVNCRYVPHVMGLVAGQELLVKSSDPTLHNVQFQGQKNAQQNFGMTHAGAQRSVKSLIEPEIVHVRCDVHPWMSAWIGVFENPYFAVTGDDGTFEIKDLPSGEYKLVAWHELYGELKRPLKVDEKQPAEVKFEYKQ
jgi:hypothetical protein